MISLIIIQTIIQLLIKIEGAPCTPNSGLTGLIIGQDLSSIRNYTDAIKDNEKPFGLMSYTAIHDKKNGDLAGVTNPIDYGSGIQWTQGLTETYPESSIQLGLWLVDQCKTVAAGGFDNVIDDLIQFVNTSSVDFYIRIGYEFDSLENNYPPGDYVAAFRHIVRSFRTARVNNAAFVWHASGFVPRDELKFVDWFPGATFVDWCGVSIFQQPYDCQSATECTMEYPDLFASFCSKNKIPIMIAESTPFGGILSEKELSKDPYAENEAGYTGSTWNRWFVPVMGFILKHDVRMWSYINCDWDSQPMWKKKHAPGLLWGDSRVQEYDYILKRWNDEILGAKRFLNTYGGSNVCQNKPDDVEKVFANDDDDVNKNATHLILDMMKSLEKGFIYLIVFASALLLAIFVYHNCYVSNRSEYTVLH